MIHCLVILLLIQSDQKQNDKNVIVDCARRILFSTLKVLIKIYRYPDFQFRSTNTPQV